MDFRINKYLVATSPAETLSRAPSLSRLPRPACTSHARWRVPPLPPHRSAHGSPPGRAWAPLAPASAARAPRGLDENELHYPRIPAAKAEGAPRSCSPPRPRGATGVESQPVEPFAGAAASGGRGCGGDGWCSGRSTPCSADWDLWSLFGQR